MDEQTAVETKDTPANIFEKHFGNTHSIFLDREAISPHFIPAQLPFRDPQIADISGTLSILLQGKKAPETASR